MAKIDSLLGKLPLIPPSGAFDETLHMNRLCDEVKSRVSKFGSKPDPDPDPKSSLEVMNDEKDKRDLHNSKGAGTSSPESHNVIISHAGSSSAANTAKNVKIALQKRGVEVSLLEEQDPSWFARCEESDICVALLSAAYLENVNPEGQLTFAKDNGKVIVPVVIDQATQSL